MTVGECGVAALGLLRTKDGPADFYVTGLLPPPMQTGYGNSAAIFGGSDAPSCRAVADEVRLRLRSRASSHVTRSRWNNRSVKASTKEHPKAGTTAKAGKGTTRSKEVDEPAVVAAPQLNRASHSHAQAHRHGHHTHGQGTRHADDANAIWRLVLDRLSGSAVDRQRLETQRLMALAAIAEVKALPRTAAYRALHDAVAEAETQARALASGDAAERYRSRAAPVLDELNALLKIPVKADPLTLEAHAPHAGRLKYLTELLLRLSRMAYPALGDDHGEQSHAPSAHDASQKDHGDAGLASHGAGGSWHGLTGAPAPARAGPANPSSTCPSCGHLTSGQCAVCGDRADAPAIRHGAALVGGRGYNEAARLAGAHHYVYARRAHFRNSIVAYQGLQRKVISPQLLSDIEEKLRQKGMLDTNAKDQKDKFRRVSRGAVTCALRQLSCPRAYRDVNLICSVLCGLPCPDVAHLEPALMLRFDMVQQTLVQLAAEPGGLPQGTATAARSGLNSQYLLYHFLRLEGVETKPSDFDMLRNVEQVLLYDNLFRQVCTRLGWPFRATY